MNCLSDSFANLMLISDKQHFFSEQLVQWNRLHNKRMMPWKNEKDPYKVWLSEIILQQTRVDQGLEYYKRFIKKYPVIGRLAAADDNEVFKLWEGLGYYSRCKNLLVTARYIAFEQKGKFPGTHGEILKLKGVGPYTAAAIASFAFGLPYAVVDGNVVRVLSRFFGISIPADSNKGKKYFAALAQKLLGKNDPALYNQAIMDFGATICKPKLPLCLQCPLQKECTAFKKNMIAVLPVKEKALQRKKRSFFFIIAEYGDKIYAKKRTEKDIWQNLWEFISVEVQEPLNAEDFIRSNEYKKIIPAGKVKAISGVFRQQLTHRDVEAVFIQVKLKKVLKSREYMAVQKAELGKLAFPRLINHFLEQGNFTAEPELKEFSQR